MRVRFFELAFGALLLTAPTAAEALVSEGELPAGTTYDCPTGNLFIPFCNIFNVETTGVAGDYFEDNWSQADVEAFMLEVIDADSTNTTDVFPQVWGYFRHKPIPAYGQIGEEKITLNLVTVGESTIDGTGNRIQLNIKDKDPVNFAHSGFAHEVYHIISKRNGAGVGGWEDEMSAAMAEYIGGTRWMGTDPNEDPAYDAALNGWISGKPKNYFMGRLLGAFLMTNYTGLSGKEDDLLYHCARHHNDGGVNNGIYGLAVALDSLSNANPGRYPVTGSSRTEKLESLLHQFAIAKYADLDGTPHGLGYDLEVLDFFGMYRWSNGCALQVRVEPSYFTIDGTALEPDTLSVWQYIGKRQSPDENPVMELSLRTRDLGLRPWASEYVVLRGDSTYFAGGDRTLTVRVESVDSEGNPIALQGTDRIMLGYVAHDSYDSSLVERPVIEVAPNVASAVAPGAFDVSFDVEEYGSTKKGIVLVASLIREPPPNMIPLSDPYCGPCQPDLEGECTPSVPVVRLRVSASLSRIRFELGLGSPEIWQVLEGASPGDAIVITQSRSFNPFSLTKDVWVHANPGVVARVLATSAAACTVSAGIVTDMEFVGSANAPVVVVGNEGRMRNCIIDGVANVSPIGIETGGEARDCTVELETGTGIRASGNAAVSGCNVSVVGGESYNYGIWQTGGEVEECFVTVPGGPGGDGGVGIRVDAGVAEHCTVYGVDKGVQTTGSGIVTYSIAAGYETVGFDGSGNTYCIAPGPNGFDPYPGSGSEESDPLFCDATNGEFTLRIDSYGSSGNNAEHAQIGAFQTVCAYGELQRNTEDPPSAPGFYAALMVNARMNVLSFLPLRCGGGLHVFNELH